MTKTLVATPDPDEPRRPGNPDPVEAEILSAPLVNPGRGGNQPPDIAETAARRARALRMRLGGMTYDQIATELGYNEASSARRLIVRALERTESRYVDEYRDVQHARLERVHASLWPLVIGSHSKTRPGQDGQPEPDPTFVDPDTRIKAAGMILRNAERDARLLGLDAPQRIDVSAGTQAQLDDALAELRQVVRGEVIGDHEDPGTTGEAGTGLSTG